MKKLILITACLFAVAAIGAQSLEQIVKSYSVANKLDKISAYKTLKLTGNMSAMGMDMPMQLWMKNPNKIKTVTNFNGQEMVQAYDGEKGYTINPMMGADPVEMTADQIKQTQRSNIFQNYLEKYLKEGLLTLEGEDAVNGKPAFKIKAALEGGNDVFMFIDKSTYLLAKTSVTVNQQGQTMVVESYPSDYKETNGVLLPMKTTTSAQGMEMVMTFTNVEVDVPIEDTVFKLK